MSTLQWQHKEAHDGTPEGYLACVVDDDGAERVYAILRTNPAAQDGDPSLVITSEELRYRQDGWSMSAISSATGLDGLDAVHLYATAEAAQLAAQEREDSVVTP
ncbi:hypothetical protein [Mycobacterium sp. 29Ha]|uniref:hypothetical protein n=1 Tax=Mycobacterium sp. 29Ha TaxID=2939268 RepID=UPI002939177F|nr:hypothetical protein [Mycobacterium sp. 29Ha]MDV3134108.1 hypothetical protein [Mycobacterium sp. 29Ha]